MRDVVCLGCGRQRSSEHSPGECPFCRDVSWTYLEDAERDPGGIARCIERRRLLVEVRQLEFDVDVLIAEILGHHHVA